MVDQNVLENVSVSVVLACYNGSRYILEQLESIVKQTHKPDEILVCDDCSTDNTVVNVNDFKALHADFNIKVVASQKNRGYNSNFEQGILAASGDVIFLSDQDDVWYDDKISTMLKTFAAAPMPAVVICDQKICSADLRDSGTTKLTNISALGFSESLFVAGCCTAVHKRFARFAFPRSGLSINYDDWIHFAAGKLGVRKVISMPLQDYRRHDSNASSSVYSRTKVGKLDGAFIKLRAATKARRWDTKLRRLYALREKLDTKSALLSAFRTEVQMQELKKGINGEISFYQLRENVQSTSAVVRPFKIFKNRKRYFERSGLRGILRDIIGM